MIDAAMSPQTTLLLVDDEAELRDLLAEYFARQGFALRRAANAEEARRLLADQVPDMDLLDLNMLGENGLSLVGTGLRLSLSRALAQEHGGTLVLEPTPPGHGASFVLSLPSAP